MDKMIFVAELIEVLDREMEKFRKLYEHFPLTPESAENCSSEQMELWENCDDLVEMENAKLADLVGKTRVYAHFSHDDNNSICGMLEYHEEIDYKDIFMGKFDVEKYYNTHDGYLLLK